MINYFIAKGYIYHINLIIILVIIVLLSWVLMEENNRAILRSQYINNI